MLAHWIWLAMRPHISDRIKADLVRRFSDPETVYFADEEALLQVEGLTAEGLEALRDKDLGQAQKVLHQCRERDLGVLTYQDAAYPARLKNISDPPLVFYYKGRLPDLNAEPIIGVVGTRHASAYGLTVAKRMGYQIARCGGTVVSGMAFGIDGMAMRGALTAGGCVIGVLGCGADVVYPVSNRALFQDTERYGCILSEFLPGTPPAKWTFPKRNRIISGLSCGVLVVEAPEKSGALITANLAAEQGRDVFAVPGNIDVPTFVGSNRLLRDGAIMVSHGWDIMSEYEAQYPDKIRKFTEASRQQVYPDEMPKAAEPVKTPRKQSRRADAEAKNREKIEKQEKIVIDKRETSPYIDLNDILPKLSEDEGKIACALESGELLVDDVIARCGLPAGKVLALLTLLEVKGIVQRLPGRRICLKKTGK